MAAPSLVSHCRQGATLTQPSCQQEPREVQVTASEEIVKISISPQPSWLAR